MEAPATAMTAMTAKTGMTTKTQLLRDDMGLGLGSECEKKN
jgi:hypothetical protein